MNLGCHVVTKKLDLVTAMIIVVFDNFGGCSGRSVEEVIRVRTKKLEHRNCLFVYCLLK